MAYTELADFKNSSEGLHVLFLYVADVVPIFIPMVLFSLFMIVMLATFYSQRRLAARGDFPSSFAVAGYVTTITAFIMTLVPNLIRTPTVIICLVISVAGTLWLFISRNR